MNTMYGNISDNSSQDVRDVATVDRETEITEYPQVEATTMTETSAGSTAGDSRTNDKDSENEGAGKTDKDCVLEVFPSELMTGPPPAYSLTSPCLPPDSPRKQDWPPESPPHFDGYPPYPAGPPLLRVAYPKDVPGPTYACPKCKGRFLYYRPAGIVYCPFCHSAISIGRYVRIRACSSIMFGLLFLMISLTFGLATKIFTDCLTSHLIVFGAIATSGIILLLRAVCMCVRYMETERIEFP